MINTGLQLSPSFDRYLLLETISKKTLTAADTAVVCDYLHSLESEFSVFDHALLLFIVRSNFLTRASRADLEPVCAKLVLESWTALAGYAPTPNLHGDIPLLPRLVVKAADDDVQIIYDTVFFLEMRKDSIFSRIKNVEHLVQESLVRLTASSFWNIETGLTIAGALLLLMVPYVNFIVMGAVIGMIGASINEYTVHLGMGHSSPELARSFRKIGLWGLWSEEINLAHRVHHSKMLMDFRAKFSNDKVLARVNTYLEVEARKLVESRVADGSTAADQAENETARIISDIKKGGYGVDGTIFGTIAMHMLALPYFLANIGLAYAAGSWTLLIASFFFLSAFITQSMYSHRYLHMTDKDIHDSIDEGTSTAFMRWFMTTPVAKLQTRRHFRHHQEKYDYQRTVNGVIMSFSFADFIFRRGVHEAEVHHLVAMRKAGFLPSSTSSKN